MRIEPALALLFVACVTAPLPDGGGGGGGAPGGGFLADAGSLASRDATGSGEDLAVHDGGRDADLAARDGSGCSGAAPACPSSRWQSLLCTADSGAAATIVDGDRVYWIGGGGAFSAPKGGGEARFHGATALGSPFASLAVDGSDLFFSDGGQLLRAPIAGGAATALEPGNLVVRLAVDAGLIYFTGLARDVGPGRGEIRSIARSGGAATVVAAGLGRPRGIAVSGGFVYFADSDRATVSRVSTSGGPVEDLAVGLSPPPAHLILDGPTLYVASDRAIYLAALPLTGGPVTILLRGANPADVPDLTADGTFLYLVAPPGVIRVGKDGASVDAIADPGVSSSLAVDDRYLFSGPRAHCK